MLAPITWKRLLQDLDDGVCLTDAAFRIRYVNPSARRLLKLGKRDVRGLPLCELLASRAKDPSLGRCEAHCAIRDGGERASGAEVHGLRVRCLKVGAWGSQGLHLTFLQEIEPPPRPMGQVL